MRYYLLFLLFSIGIQEIAVADSNPKKETDSVIGGNDKPALLIGNVTELSWGYQKFSPAPFFEGTIARYRYSSINAFSATQYLIINNYLIQSGLEYSVLASKYELNYSWDSVFQKEIQIFDTINTHYYIVNGEPVAEYVVDSYPATIADSVRKAIENTGTNKIQRITIPVNVGYRWRFDNFALYAKLGARFNFITQSSGKIFFANAREWVLFEEKINKTFYYSASVSIAYEYPFSALGSFIVEPEYCYSWYSRINTGFTKNYHRFGVKLGIQLWL